MDSFGYKPSAQSDEPTQAQPETRREDLTQHAPSPREVLPEQFRGYKVLKRMTDTTGEAQTFLVEKENQRYVLKLYHPGKTPDREVLRQIRQMTEEGKRYFPILYEHDEEGGKYYEVIEYIAGGHLGAWIKKTPSEKRLEKLPDIVRQIAEALHILHERKLIHRDLKPSNVLLRSEEPLELVLIDFGISRQIDREATKHATVVFKGTPAYCAPEEFTGLFGREADWWHLGIVAYEVIKGEHPFAGVNQAAIQYQISTQDIALPDTADRYRVLLRGLLNRNPKERWGYEQVRAWLEGKVEFVQQTSPQSPIQYSLQDWEKAGFTAYSARLWAELGLSPEEAQSFYEASFSVEEARPWVEVGFKNAKICKGWRDAGFKPEETNVFESLGLHIEHAKRLKAWKITALHLSPDHRGQTKLINSLNNLLTDLDSLKANPQSPPEWVSELLNDSELSSELKRRHRSSTHSAMLKVIGGELASAMVEQLTPDLLIEAAQQEVSAAELLKAQVYGVPLKDYLKYRPHGLSLQQARELLQAGVKPEDFAEDAEQGLTYAEIREVFRRKVDLGEYLHFRRYGVTPEQAEELLRAGVKSRDYARGAEEGLAYSEILEVFRRKVDLGEYLRFRRYGVTPEQAEELLRAGVKSRDYARGAEEGLAYSEILEVFRRKVDLGEYLRFRRYGVTPEQAEELLRAGVKSRDYARGAEEGLAYSEILEVFRRKVNLGEYLRFRRYGVTPEQAEELLGAGVRSEDYAKGVEEGLTYSEILEVFRREVDLGEYLRFRRYGVTPEQAEELLGAGVRSEDYAKGVEEGLTYAEILEVFRREVDFREYLHFRRYGVTPEQAEELLGAGVRSEDYAKGVEEGLTYAEILEVFRRKVDLSEYLHFRRYGVTPEQAEELLGAGVRSEDYAKGVEEGLTYAEILEVFRRKVDLGEYLHFRKYGVTLRQAEELLEAGVRSGDYAKGAEEGLTYAEILEVFRREVDLSEYLHFRKYGVTLEQAEALLRAKVRSEDYAKGVEEGLTYPEVLEISRRGVDLSEYLHFRKYGVTLRQAEELLGAGVRSEDYAKGVEEGLTYPEVLEISRRGVNLSEYLHLRKYGITLRESIFVAQGLQQIAIEGPLSVSSPLIIENSSLTLKNLSLWTLQVLNSQVILEGCSFSQGEDFRYPRLKIVSSEVALEGVRIEGGKVGIHVRDSRLTLREVSLTGLEGVGMWIEGKTAVEGEQLSISKCGCGMEVHPGARVQLTRPTLTENGAGIVVEGADLVLKGPGELTHHQGPAILVEKNGTLSAEELTFEKNQKDSSTGQIHLVGASKVSLQKITVQNSEAKGLYAENCPDIRMTNSTFTSNLYNAICLVKSRLIASEVKILENGGKVWRDYYWQVALFDHAHLKIEKSRIEHGEAGGIYAERSEVEVADCIVAHHQLDGLRANDSSTAKVVGGTFRANLNDQIAGYNHSTVEVRDAVLDGDGKSQRGLYMQKGHVAIKNCQIHSHNQNGVRVEGGSGCTIEDSQLENNGLASSKKNHYPQLFVEEVEKVALSDLRVIGGKGEGVVLDLCKNASLSGKSIIRGNQHTGLWALRTQLTVEQAEFQDNGKASTPDSYYYQILADNASNVQLKEVQIYEGRHSGGIWVRKQSTVKLEGGSIYWHGREAIRVEGSWDEESKMVVIGARIYENAQQTGAQVIVKYNGTAEMEDARIQDSLHGGVFVENGGILILTRCEIHSNHAYNLQKGDSGRVKFIGMSRRGDSSLHPREGILLNLIHNLSRLFFKLFSKRLGKAYGSGRVNFKRLPKSMRPPKPPKR